MWPLFSTWLWPRLEHNTPWLTKSVKTSATVPGLKHVGDLNKERHAHTADWQRGQLWGARFGNKATRENIHSGGRILFELHTYVELQIYIDVFYRCMPNQAFNIFIHTYICTHTLQAVGERKHTHSGRKKKNRLTCVPFVKTFNTTCLTESSIPLWRSCDLNAVSGKLFSLGRNWCLELCLSNSVIPP